jgi:predicted outer membrane repeat protein
VVAGVVATPQVASAKSLFIIGCDEASTSDEAQLIAAVDAANDEDAHPGEDVVQLADGCTYTLATPVSSSPPRPGLPEITSAITFWGHGAVIQSVSGSDVDHLFWVDDTGDLTLTDLRLTNNGVAVVIGGAAVNNWGYLTLDGVMVDNFSGGAISASGQSTTIMNSVFKDNFIFNYHGAAISANSSLIVQNSSFEDNSAQHQDDPRVSASGGAIYLGTASGGFITDTTFTGNDTDGVGGAIAGLGSLAVTDSTFTGNNALNDGGAIYAGSDASLTLTDSYFTGNHSIRGGALNSAGTASVSNSTFYANTAGGGGAVFQWGGLLNIGNSTFSSNDATVEGDAFDRYSGTGMTSRSVFANHSSACSGLTAGDWDLLDHFDASCPGNMLLGTPRLQSPALNGGPTKTMRLGAGSDAAERITSGCPSTDQRGYTRPSGAKCDIGAYEDQAPTAPGTPSITTGSNPTRTGALTLSWSGASDADDTVGYRLLHKDADDASYSQVGTTTATSMAINEAEGTYSYVVEAYDGNHSVPSSSALTGVVVDKTAPPAPTLSADRDPEYAGTPSWYLDTVTVTTTSNGDPDLADTSPGSGVATVPADVTYDTSGTFTATETLSDLAGNVSGSTSLTVNVDAELPDVSFGVCPATVLLGRSATASWSASDASSGLATPAAGSFSLDTATIGHKTVSTTATDNVGHSRIATCAYDVVFDFTGFFNPLANAPAVTKASAGQNLPVSFSLGGNQGLAIFAPGYPQSVQTSCNAFGAQTAGTSTAVAKPGLTYSTGGGGRYTYLWKTERAWRGTCRQLIVKLVDGTYHRANVSFA